MARPSRSRIGHAAILAALLGLTAAVYLQVHRHPFIDLDDGQYVAANPHVRAGLTREGIRWAFAATDGSHWHPITWMSHQADVELFGLSPGAHHLVNVVLHLVNAALLYSLFAAMTGCRPRAAFVAAVFALHPLHVESVAWISERKDLLSALFGLLALIAYVRYARKPSLRTGLPVPVLMAMSLLSKPMLVTLSFAFLLLDYWPLGRLGGGPAPAAGGPAAKTAGVRPGRLLAEKAPLFALSAASVAVTLVVQWKRGALAPAELFPFPARAANALAAYAGYIVKTAWPHPLAPFYPYPAGGIPVREAAACAAFLALVTGAALHFRKERPALPVGWFWYLGTLVPVIGLVQSGAQAAADRYTYLPQTGLAIMIAYGAFRASPRGLPRAAAAPAALLLVAAMSAATFFQARLWSSDEALFSHAARTTEGNFVAYDALGKSALAKGRMDEAIRWLEEAARIRPSYAPVRYNLGVAYGLLGLSGKAMSEYREALRLRPGFADAWTNLGALYLASGRVDDAARCCLEALRLNPDDPLAHNNLGMVLARKGNRADAAAHFRQALRVDPGFAAAAENLRAALAR